MAIRMGADAHGAWIEPHGSPAEGIRLNASSSRVGLFIDPTGKVRIGNSVNAPEAQLQVMGVVKAQAIDTGDLVFRKNGEALWRMFEETSGLFVENVATGRTSRVFLEEDLKPLRNEIDELRSRLKKLAASTDRTI